MRAEKRKRYIPFFLTFVLILSIPAVYLRVLLANRHIGSKEITVITGENGTITDRYGIPLYDGTCKNPEIIGNLIGGSPHMSKTLVNLYAEELAPSGFNPLVGVDSLENATAHTMTTTLLPIKEQKRLQDAFKGYNGALFAYNYKTGEVYCMLSLPSTFENEAENGAYTNRCLSSVYIPGSTMKIIATICALDQDRDLQNFQATCTGKLELPDGSVVKCTGVHGTVDLTKAIGRSCNCYMAALIQELDEDAARETMRQLGIYPTGEGATATVDKLQRTTSSTHFRSAHIFQDVWALIGQGDSLVNVIDMAMIAGSVVNGGQTAQPYLVASIGVTDADKLTYQAKPGEQTRLIDDDTAKLVNQYWTDAVAKYYSDRVCSTITHAKTGTAQQGNDQTNRTLMGVMEEYDTAFFLVVEGLPAGDKLIFEIANTLAEIIPAYAE